MFFEHFFFLIISYIGECFMFFYSFISNLSFIVQAFVAGMFTFFVTFLGSSCIFFFKSVHKNMMNSMLSLSAGIMLAAAFFSLLNPAIKLSNELNLLTWFVVLFGFLLGGICIYIGNTVAARLLSNSEEASKTKRCILLFSSITLHNIPEGLAIGVAFGSITNSSLYGAIALTLGIAIQNFPEGAAISFPLRRDGFSRFKAFLFGTFSGIVEPFSAVVGAILVVKIRMILPFILSFAAGAMIFVTVFDLIPESQNNSLNDFMTIIFMIGFSIMMVLEIVL